jgi:hypothetical protein
MAAAMNRELLASDISFPQAIFLVVIDVADPCNETNERTQAAVLPHSACRSSYGDE